jgi:photosystem II stability/assembly factor-like uncharacterized protein
MTAGFCAPKMGRSLAEVRYDSELGEPCSGIWSAGGTRVLAFGSFGKFYQSDDDGRTWQTSRLSVDSAHLNGMDGGPDGRRMVVGEQGLVMRTDDAGHSWQNPGTVLQRLAVWRGALERCNAG